MATLRNSQNFIKPNRNYWLSVICFCPRSNFILNSAVDKTIVNHAKRFP